ncbi:hypothetical protein LZ31DRAFT_135532 [Colletotrichum somersetense]|nr:hypothetical protein LZ31DRAFT_135532 [Colletotrichum somersetense]
MSVGLHIASCSFFPRGRILGGIDQPRSPAAPSTGPLVHTPPPLLWHTMAYFSPLGFWFSRKTPPNGRRLCWANCPCEKKPRPGRLTSMNLRSLGPGVPVSPQNGVQGPPFRLGIIRPRGPRGHYRLGWPGALPKRRCMAALLCSTLSIKTEMINGCCETSHIPPRPPCSLSTAGLALLRVQR